VQSVTGILPIIVNNGTDDAVVSIAPATINSPGSMSSADKFKLDGIPANAAPGTVTSITTGSGLTGGPITVSGQIDLEPATKTSEGGVVIGDNIDVDAAGVISIPTGRFGVQSLNIGSGLVGSPSTITSTGTITAALATRLTVGSVRIGNGINVALDGTISVAGSLEKVGILAWAQIKVTLGSNPPTFTLLEGYNVSAIEWQGTPDAPRVQVNFQNQLANTNYGFLSGVGPVQYGSPNTTSQDSYVIGSSFKSGVYCQFQLQRISTADWRNPGGTITWNDWSTLDTFDIAIVDTQVF
jgi:hypothetical protein